MKFGVVVAAAVSAAILAAPSVAFAVDWPGRAAADVRTFRSAGSPTARAEVLRGLRAADDETARAVVEVALEERDLEVRVAAIELIGSMRLDGFRDELLAALGARPSEVRAAAAEALGQFRDPGLVTPVARLLADADAEVRAAAARGLGASGVREALVPLVGVVEDRSRDVVIAALEALGRFGQPATVYVVLERVHDPVEEVALAAVSAAAAIRAPEAVAALIDLVETGRPSVATAAMAALASLSAEDAVPALIGQVVSPRYAGASAWAVEALVLLEPDGVAPELVEAAASAPDLVAPYFAAIGARAWPELADAWARQGKSQAGRNILSVWLSSGDPRAVERVAEWMPSDPTEDATWAVDWYRRSNTSAAFCAAVAAYRGVVPATLLDDWTTWAADANAIDCLLAGVEDPDSLSASQVWRLVEAAAAAGDLDSAAAVVDAMVEPRSVDWRDAAPAVAALARHGVAAAPILREVLGSDDPRLRREVAYVLAEWRGLAVDDPLWSQVSGARVGPEVLRALAAWRGGPGEARAMAVARTLARGGTRAERVEALAVLRQDCGLTDLNAVRSALDAADFWWRRAGWEYAATCAPEVLLGRSPPPDAAARALAMQIGTPSADSLAVAFSDTALGAGERVEALRRLAAVDAAAAAALAADHVRDRDPRIAGAARLVAAAPMGDAAATDLSLAAAAGVSPLERAAALYVLARGGYEAAVEMVLRREDDPAVRRAARPGAAGADDAVVPMIPTTVFLVDGRSGMPRSDEEVFVITADGEPLLLRSDAEGRIVVPGRPPVVVLPVTTDP